jgi:hypothetical protein
MVSAFMGLVLRNVGSAQEARGRVAVAQSGYLRVPNRLVRDQNWDDTIHRLKRRL